jgi:hypothetical protein
MLSTYSCQAKDKRAKSQMIENRISEIKIEKSKADSITNKNSEGQKNQIIQNQVSDNQLKSKNAESNKGDSIIGIWEVKNDYYVAIYEIIKYKEQYFGKIHYYNDGEKEIKAQRSEDDYFLDGVFYKDDKFTSGKMYLQDGSQIQVGFSLNKDELTAKMIIDGQPYKEIWKRKRYQ